MRPTVSPPRDTDMRNTRKRAPKCLGRQPLNQARRLHNIAVASRCAYHTGANDRRLIMSGNFDLLSLNKSSITKLALLACLCLMTPTWAAYEDHPSGTVSITSKSV